MGKVVGKILTIGAIVVAAAFTAGAAAFGVAALSAGASFGAALSIAGGFLAANSAWIIGASLVGSLGSALSAKKPKIDIDSQVGDVTQLNVASNPPKKWVFGLTASAMDMVYAEVFGSDPKHVAIVLVHSASKITSYERLWINGELIGSSGTTVGGRWAGLIARQQRLGTASQTAMSINGGARWTSSAKLSGRAAQTFDFTSDQEVNPTGTPSKMVQEVKGSPVYDPRLDSTRGGSGTHRADDQSTWEYTNNSIDIGRNAALIYATYLLGWHDNGVLQMGPGFNPNDINWQSVITAANICEANNWFFDGLLSEPDGSGYGENLRNILSSCGGEITDIGGRIGLRVPYDDTASVVLDIGPDRISGAVQRSGRPGLNSRANILRGRFSDPDAIYQAVDYPEVRLSTEIAVEGELVESFNFPGCKDSDTCQQLANLVLKESRQEVLNFKTTLEGLAAHNGSIVRLKLPEYGLDDTLCRVVRRVLLPNEKLIEMVGQVVDPSDYVGITPSPKLVLNDPTISFFDDISTLAHNTVNVGSTSSADVEDGVARALAVIRADLGTVNDVSLYQSGITRVLTRGLSEGPVRDGDAIVFGQAWDALDLPVISFEGGRTDQGTLANETNARYRALNLSSTGFTADLKIVEAIGSPVTHQDTEASGGTNTQREAEKSQVAEAVDDTYFYKFSVLITNGPIVGGSFRNPGKITLGFYTNDGGGWVQRKTKTFFGSSAVGDAQTAYLNEIVDVFVDGLGQIAGREFRIVVEDSGLYGADLTALVYVEYMTAGPVGFVTATPTGAPDMRYFVQGGVQ